ncbi:MAG: serine/threonine-protein kinase, partial [Polyangiaceae bacterium]
PPSFELSPIQVGEILAGKYRVERLLGAGGMGVVVLARHIQLDQLVAVKFLLAESLKNPKVVARFEREARAVVKLKGDHVARVLDVGVMETGAPYIVMEYLEGEDLANAVERRGQLPIAEAVDYLLQTCEALAEAHALGIVHRDLKPGNLFLTKRVDGKGLVKVLDFGISKLEGDRENLTLTHTTEVLGSPKYMSPEQLRASRFADARSDIWSLGVILYELITADMPFLAETLAHLCALVISDQPRPMRSLRPDIPPGIEAIILRCMEKDPNKRFQNVSDLAMALDPFTSTLQTSAAQRIQAVAASSSGSFASVPTTAPNVIGGGHGSQSTSIGWGQTELKPVTPSRGKWIAIGALGLVVVGVGVAFFTLHGHAIASTDVPVTSSSASASASSSASTEVAALTSASSAPTGSVTAPASASVSAAPHASGSTTGAAAHSGHHGGKKPLHPATPAANDDDMPNERN